LESSGQEILRLSKIKRLISENFKRRSQKVTELILTKKNRSMEETKI
jgi:hypothetical protein